MYQSKRQAPAGPVLDDIFAAFSGGLPAGSANPGGPLLAFVDINTAYVLLSVARFTRRAVQDCTWPFWFNVPRIHLQSKMNRWRVFFPRALTVHVVAPRQSHVAVPAPTLLGCTRVVLGPRIRILNASRTALEADLSTVDELQLNYVEDLPDIITQLALHDHNGARAARRLRRLHLDFIDDTFLSYFNIIKLVAPLALTHLHLPLDGLTCAKYFANTHVLLPVPPRAPHAIPTDPADRPARVTVPAFASLTSLSLHLVMEDTAELSSLSVLPVLRVLTLTANSSAVIYTGVAGLPHLSELTLVGFSFYKPKQATALLNDLEDAALPQRAPLLLRILDSHLPEATRAALLVLQARRVIVLTH